MAFDNTDPASIVAGYTAAITAGDTDQAARLASAAASLGQELRATTARCGYELRRCHESQYDDLNTEDDRAEAGIRILEAVPALKAAIEDMHDVDVDGIWAEHGPPVDEDEDEDA